MRSYRTLLTRVIATVVIALFSGGVAHAVSLTMEWQRSPDSNVTGYRIYATDFDTGIKNQIDAGNTSAAVLDFTEGKTYLFYVTAYSVDGLESDPSNAVTFTVPTTPPPPPPPPPQQFALRFGGFGNATVQYSPRGTSIGSLGEMYNAATSVTVSATPISGYNCTGWTINSVFYSGNPQTVVMNQNTIATPTIKKKGPGGPDPLPSQISMSIKVSAGNPVVTIGGELGAWALEQTSNFSTWVEVKRGMTSEQVALPTTGANGVLRVHSVQLQPMQ